MVGGECQVVRRPEEQGKELAVYTTEESPLAGLVSAVSRLVCAIDVYDHATGMVGSLQRESSEELKVGVGISRERRVRHGLPAQHLPQSEQDHLRRNDDRGLSEQRQGATHPFVPHDKPVPGCCEAAEVVTDGAVPLGEQVALTGDEGGGQREPLTEGAPLS